MAPSNVEPKGCHSPTDTWPRLRKRAGSRIGCSMLCLVVFIQLMSVGWAGMLSGKAEDFLVSSNHHAAELTATTGDMASFWPVTRRQLSINDETPGNRLYRKRTAVNKLVTEEEEEGENTAATSSSSSGGGGGSGSSSSSSSDGSSKVTSLAMSARFTGGSVKRDSSSAVDDDDDDVSRDNDAAGVSGGVAKSATGDASSAAASDVEGEDEEALLKVAALRRRGGEGGSGEGLAGGAVGGGRGSEKELVEGGGNILDLAGGEGNDVEEEKGSETLGVAEGKIQPTADLAAWSAFDLSDPIVAQYAAMVDVSLEPWAKISGMKAGMGSRGMISKDMLKAEASMPNLMSCSGHVKVVGGRVYFRYGGFLREWYRLRRFHQSIRMIQDAVDKYGLTDIAAEFLLSTCDLPISSDSSETNIRSGYPIFSTEHTPGHIDILFPDPLDLAEGYMPTIETQVPWDQKKPQAIFRGATTNYNLKPDGNWRANPRFRLHRLSDLRPDLLDARIMRWSHATQDAIKKFTADGFSLGSRINQREKNSFKYEVVVDGGVGSCRTCGVLMSNQAMIRQASVFSEFFEPMLKPFVHYIPTKHHFGDLIERVEWGKEHDKEVLQIVQNANNVAKYACTWEGRTLYWAILLAKYSKNALESPEEIEPPSKLCGGSPAQSVLKMHKYAPSGAVEVDKSWPPLCSAVEGATQPTCTFFCIHGHIKEEDFVWLSSENLSDVPRLGPHQ